MKGIRRDGFCEYISPPKVGKLCKALSHRFLNLPRVGDHDDATANRARSKPSVTVTPFVLHGQIDRMEGQALIAGRSLLESADAHRYPRVRKAHDEGENQKLDYLQLRCRSERGQRLQIPRRCRHLGSRPGCE